MSQLSKGKLKSLFGGNLKQYTMLIALIAVVLFFQYIEPRSSGRLLTPLNVSNLIFQYAYVIILAIGMLICILTGGNIDLSVGSVVAVVSAMAGYFMKEQKMDVYLSMGICLVAGLVIGIWQGFWIAYVRIPAFIVTLSSMLVFRGLTGIIVRGQTISGLPEEFLSIFNSFIPDWFGPFELFGMTVNGLAFFAGVLLAVVFAAIQLFGFFSRRRKGYVVGSVQGLTVKLSIIGLFIIALFTTLARHKGVPAVLLTLGVLLIVYSFFTNNTVMGRHIYALGGNEKAARLSGVKTNKLLFFAYVNMAFLAAIAGLVTTVRHASANPTAGTGYELDAIAACYIGGASAYGGIGTVSGTLIGALLMGVLNNGMSLANISQFMQSVVKGLVLLAAVAFDVISKKQTALPVFTNPLRRKARQLQNVAGRLF
ncbi:MAG: sugar ABC transporter permease [Clostridia bacterium]|nr:sugar ABC transporter permease [Clostridia bacterium]